MLSPSVFHPNKSQLPRNHWIGSRENRWTSKPQNHGIFHDFPMKDVGFNRKVSLKPIQSTERYDLRDLPRMVKHPALGVVRLDYDYPPAPGDSDHPGAVQRKSDADDDLMMVNGWLMDGIYGYIYIWYISMFYNIWLVVTGTMEFLMTFHSVANGKSSQLTKTYFSEGLKPPTS